MASSGQSEILRPPLAGALVARVARRSNVAGDLLHGDKQPLDVGGRGEQSTRGTYRSRKVAAAAVTGLVSKCLDVVGREIEQSDEVGMGTEAAVVDADTEFRAQPGRDEGMRYPLDHERGHRQRVGVETGAEQSDARNRVEPGPKDSSDRVVMDPDRVPNRSRSRASDGGVAARSPPITPGEPASSPRSGAEVHIDLVQVDEVDRSAADQERVALVRRSHAVRSMRPTPEGAYSLWAREHDVVGGWRGDLTVRGELWAASTGRRHPVIVCGRDQLLDGGQPTRHVGGAS